MVQIPIYQQASPGSVAERSEYVIRMLACGKLTFSKLSPQVTDEGKTATVETHKLFGFVIPSSAPSGHLPPREGFSSINWDFTNSAFL